jgi:septum formation protein
MSAAIGPLVLASGSPRRVALLAELGVPFRTVVSDAPEIFDPRLDPEDQAVKIAERKARAVATPLQAGIVLGADTIVVLDGALLGKPVDDADATSMLRRLSARASRRHRDRRRRRRDRLPAHIRCREPRQLSRAD